MPHLHFLSYRYRSPASENHSSNCPPELRSSCFGIVLIRPGAWCASDDGAALLEGRGVSDDAALPADLTAPVDAMLPAVYGRSVGRGAPDDAVLPADLTAPVDAMLPAVYGRSIGREGSGGLPSGAGAGWPHLWQNIAPALNSTPHFLQNISFLLRYCCRSRPRSLYM